MPSVTVPELKAQLNLDHDLDDALLSHQIEAAEAHVASFIGSPLTDPLPAAIRQAVLMLAAYWYETRETAQAGGAPYAVPFGVHDLLQPHRVWVV
ncbi:putative phage protein (predicted DNA packaging)/uncharacterized phiE125 gp8 family phage protein [Rhodobacter viridis]|uniref:Putative phage protein (Predicted DNA packaging)/uncharacterized phiE125 gp8 family phage protein n=1 Tax=Rhodobacter viridis TaxID=1054202 RepID=A0A318TS32_9RHOB|nr:head-tail connector protein [Rhodobacter viridis]PYF06737.1 putative phage protein (predicted DNA packaging)/uncharacterized phiE125 gp8 family phage protein [Rhodobacter viridis]